MMDLVVPLWSLVYSLSSCHHLHTILHCRVSPEQYNYPSHLIPRGTHIPLVSIVPGSIAPCEYQSYNAIAHCTSGFGSEV